VAAAVFPAAGVFADPGKGDMRIAFWRKPTVPRERRQALEEWARLRLELLQEDLMIALIGAVGRLTDEGMELAAAMEFVLGVLHEGEPPAS
jgi:hypothetical protein